MTGRVNNDDIFFPVWIVSFMKTATEFQMIKTVTSDLQKKESKHPTHTKELFLDLFILCILPTCMCVYVPGAPRSQEKASWNWSNGWL